MLPFIAFDVPSRYVEDALAGCGSPTFKSTVKNTILQVDAVRKGIVAESISDFERKHTTS